jgi:hypothetical protein
MADEWHEKAREALANAVSQQCDTTISPQKLLAYPSLKALGEEYRLDELQYWMILSAVEEELVGTSGLADLYRALRKDGAPLSQEQRDSLLAHAASGICRTDIPEFIDRPVEQLVLCLAKEFRSRKEAEESVRGIADRTRHPMEELSEVFGTEAGDSFFESMAFSCFVNASAHLLPYQEVLYRDKDEDDRERNSSIENARRDIRLGMRHSTELSPKREDVAKHVALFLEARCCALSGEYSAATRRFSEYVSWLSCGDGERACRVLKADHDQEEMPGDLGRALGLSGLDLVSQYLKKKDTTASALRVLDYTIVNSSDLGLSEETLREVQKEAGRWREEQEQEQKSGCFVATAAYGTASAPNVAFLRAFRDSVLLKRHWGKELVHIYYAVSPPLARLIGSNGILRAAARLLLVQPLVFVVKTFLFRCEDGSARSVSNKERSQNGR